jgi:transcription elongation factor
MKTESVLALNKYRKQKKNIVVNEVFLKLFIIKSKVIAEVAIARLCINLTVPKFEIFSIVPIRAVNPVRCAPKRNSAVI